MPKWRARALLFCRSSHDEASQSARSTSTPQFGSKPASSFGLAGLPDLVVEFCSIFVCKFILKNKYIKIKIEFDQKCEQNVSVESLIEREKEKERLVKVRL